MSVATAAAVVAAAATVATAVSAATASAPKMPELPSVPTSTDPSALASAAQQEVNAAQAAGRQSTIATSGQGDTSAPTTGKSTLLGVT